MQDADNQYRIPHAQNINMPPAVDPCEMKKIDLIASPRGTVSLKILKMTNQEAEHRTTTGELVHDLIGRIQSHCEAEIEPAWIVASFNRPALCFVVQLPEPLAQVVKQVYGRPIVFHATEAEVHYQLTYVEGIDLSKKKFQVDTIYWGLLHVPITCVLNDGDLKSFFADKLDKVGLRLTKFANQIDKNTEVRTLRWRFVFEFNQGYSPDLLKRLAPIEFPPDGSEVTPLFSEEFCHEQHVHRDCLKFMYAQTSQGMRPPKFGDVCVCTRQGQPASSNAQAGENRRRARAAAAESFHARRKRRLEEAAKGDRDPFA